MTYNIAIPSYKRDKTVKIKTLKVLEKYKISPKKVTIFVANEEEKDKYTKTLSDCQYKNIVVAKPTLCAARNFIRSYYNEGDMVLNLDDDLERVLYRVDSKTLVDVEDFEKDVIFRGFDSLVDSKSKIFGIYAAANPMFMSNKIDRGLYYIIGSLWGIINSHDPDLYLTLEDKEDFERTLQYYVKYGEVTRLNDITVKSKYYTEQGGLQETRTPERILESAQFLESKYPDLCKMYIRKTTGHAELRLRDQRKDKTAIDTNNLDAFF